MKTVFTLLMSLAFAPSAAAQSADWKKAWDDTLAAAKKEGKVVVVGSPDPVMRNRIVPRFSELYGIQVDFIAGRSSQIISKVRLERAAGQNLVDVYMSGAGTTFFTLLPEKMLDPLQPLLIHPDVTDSSKWKRGKPWFVDQEGYVLMLFSSVQSLLFINTGYVKREELRSVQDLLNPKWTGKISSEDPLGRAGGGGAGSSLHWFHELGPEFMRKLHFGQKTTVSGDRRQMIDWLAQGKYPICLSCKEEGASDLKEEGFKLFEVFELEGIPNRINSSPFLLSYANKAPHPNAARVFVNWLAGKEALEIYSRENGTATLRTDVDESFLDPRVIPRPGVKYVDVTDIKWITSGRKEAAEKMLQALKNQ
jgi:iron(III) transport system substrate-binding protein